MNYFILRVLKPELPRTFFFSLPLFLPFLFPFLLSLVCDPLSLSYFFSSSFFSLLPTSSPSSSRESTLLNNHLSLQPSFSPAAGPPMSSLTLSSLLPQLALLHFFLPRPPHHQAEFLTISNHSWLVIIFHRSLTLVRCSSLPLALPPSGTLKLHAHLRQLHSL